MRVLTTLEELDAAFRTGPVPVWGYARVSTAKQADEGVSLEAQATAIQRYCKAHNLGEPIIVREEASAGAQMFTSTLSGTALQHGAAKSSPRPMLARLLAGLAQASHNIHSQHLVFYRQDRLSRVGREVEMLLHLLDKHRVTPHSTEEPNLYESSDPVRVLVREILGLFAQYERSTIIQRARAGMEQKASKGGWIGGRLPLGYSHLKGELTPSPVEAEQAAVRLIFALRTEGRSYNEIAKMGRSAFPTIRWSKCTVARTLHNQDLYCGEIVTPDGTVVVKPELRLLPHDLRKLRSTPYGPQSAPHTDDEDDSIPTTILVQEIPTYVPQP
jgi:DNA invertase Pin-like site-specific DNA recombinase